jgi:hypothetical protein
MNEIREFEVKVGLIVYFDNPKAVIDEARLENYLITLLETGSQEMDVAECDAREV